MKREIRIAKGGSKGDFFLKRNISHYLGNILRFQKRHGSGIFNEQLRDER